MIKNSFRTGVIAVGLAALVGCTSSEPSSSIRLDLEAAGRVIAIRPSEELCNGAKVYEVKIDNDTLREQRNTGEIIAVCYIPADTTTSVDMGVGVRYFFSGMMRTTQEKGILSGNAILLPVVVPPFSSESQRAPPLYDVKTVSGID